MVALALRSFLAAFMYFLAFRVKMLVRPQRDPCLVLSLPNGSVDLATHSVSLGRLPIPHAALRGGLPAFLYHTSSSLSRSSLNEKTKSAGRWLFTYRPRSLSPLPLAPFLMGHRDADQGSRPP